MQTIALSVKCAGSEDIFYTCTHNKPLDLILGQIFIFLIKQQSISNLISPDNLKGECIVLISFGAKTKLLHDLKINLLFFVIG